jgi:hypothetical protein
MKGTSRCGVTLLAASIFVAGACADSFSPFVGQRYALVSLGGEALPTSPMVGGDVIMVADTVTFVAMSASAGRLAHRQTARLTNPEPAIIHSTFEEEFTRAGDALGFIEPLCPPNALCAFIPHHARFSSDTLVITYESDRVRQQRFLRIR